MANSDDSSSWKLFELAYENLQSISKAQRFYLSLLLVYLCAVWGWYFVGGGEAVTIQVVGITLKTGGLWIITPAVTTLLALALIGAVNAAGPAWKRLQKAAAQTSLPELRRGLVFYQLDTHKNIFDYFTFLRIHPEEVPREEPRPRFDVRHFLYPLLFAASIWTTWTAITKVYDLGELFHHQRFLVYGASCLLFQGAYSIRPWYRAICRFLGVRLQFVRD